MNVKEFTDANDEANKFKNRLANALPCKPTPNVACGIDMLQYWFMPVVLVCIISTRRRWPSS